MTQSRMNNSASCVWLCFICYDFESETVSFPHPDCQEPIFFPRSAALGERVVNCQGVVHRNKSIENSPKTQRRNAPLIVTTQAVVSDKTGPGSAEKISQNPCRPGNCEGLDGLAPIRMIVETRNKQRHPYQYPENHQHHG